MHWRAAPDQLEFGHKAHTRGGGDYEMPDALTSCLVHWEQRRVVPGLANSAV
jgi:hypothetical protein